MATLVSALRRLPGLEHQAFCAYWLHRHARLAEANADNEGYGQLHADAAGTAQACAEAELPVAGLDGLARACLRNTGVFLDRMSASSTG